MNIQLNFNPVKITKYLTVSVCFLLLAHAAVQFSVFYLDHNDVFGLVEMFDVDSEKNIPTFYSFLTLLFSSALLSIIAFGKKVNNSGYWLHWTGMAAIFLFLSIDEFASIHELFNRPISLALNVSRHINMEDASDYPRYLWVIPYGILVIVFFLTYLRFLLDLPGEVKLLFFIAGLIFVSGAIGCELIWEIWYDPGVSHTIGDEIITTVEEMLEMAGIIVFIYALLSYIKSEYRKLTITISL